MDSQGHDIQSPGAGRTVEGLAGRRILLGITGSIAAYKAAVLCRLLKCAGAEVRVVMTPLAKQFITPLTMATLSKNPILVEFFDPENGAWNSHVSLGEWADCYLIAPATANTLAKMACGIADNLLLTTYLSARCPVVVSPAMDLDMYAHPATQENLRRLAERGVRIVQPAEGELASGLTGKGRMAEPADIAAFVGQLVEVHVHHVVGVLAKPVRRGILYFFRLAGRIETASNSLAVNLDLVNLVLRIGLVPRKLPIPIPFLIV